MKFLVILGLFLSQQTVFAGGLLSQSTKHLLKSGSIFKLQLPFYGKAAPGTVASDQLSALAEINSSPELIEEARSVVEVEHGADMLNSLEELLEFKRVAESLGVELSIATSLLVAAVILGEDSGITRERISVFG